MTKIYIIIGVLVLLYIFYRWMKRRAAKLREENSVPLPARDLTPQLERFMKNAEGYEAILKKIEGYGKHLPTLVVLELLDREERKTL